LSVTDVAPQERESRACAKCGKTDTHSHHIQYVAFTHPVTGMGTDLSVTKHTQCCAEDGCPICTTDLEHAEKAQVPDHKNPSDAFTAFMVATRSDEHAQALFERHGIETPKFAIPGTQEASA
jgi:hypothetical protein